MNSFLSKNYSRFLSPNNKSLNIDRKKEILKKIIEKEVENLIKLQNELNDLKSEKTMKIILKNNYINERDILKKEIKDIKLNNKTEEEKVNKELEEIKKSNELNLNLKDKDNILKLNNYKANIEKIVNEEKIKKKNELTQYKKKFDINKNDNEVENKYEKSLREYKKKTAKIIEITKGAVSKKKERINLLKNRYANEIEKIEEKNNLEIKIKKKELYEIINTELLKINNLKSSNRCRNGSSINLSSNLYSIDIY